MGLLIGSPTDFMSGQRVHKFFHWYIDSQDAKKRLISLWKHDINRK